MIRPFLSALGPVNGRAAWLQTALSAIVLVQLCTPNAWATTCESDDDCELWEHCDREGLCATRTGERGCTDECGSHRACVMPADVCSNLPSDDTISMPGPGRACGDGFVVPAFSVPDGVTVCDDGRVNNDFGPGACRRYCIAAHCGDGVRDPGEECDIGTDEMLPDRCRPDCREPWCGDGVIDAEYGEACDDGEANSDTEPDACRSDCWPARCGDGVVDSEEQCDDLSDGRCDMYASRCELACGEPGQQCCASGEACISDAICLPSGLCAECGQANEVCCPDSERACDDPSFVCEFGWCRGCGDIDSPCCTTGRTECSDEFVECLPDARCGCADEGVSGLYGAFTDCGLGQRWLVESESGLALCGSGCEVSGMTCGFDFVSFPEGVFPSFGEYASDSTSPICAPRALTYSLGDTTVTFDPVDAWRDGDSRARTYEVAFSGSDADLRIHLELSAPADLTHLVTLRSR